MTAAYEDVIDLPRLRRYDSKIKDYVSEAVDAVEPIVGDGLSISDSILSAKSYFTTATSGADTFHVLVIE